MGRAVTQIAGMTFGRLTAIEPTQSDAYNNMHWRCRCSCGNEHVTRGTDLRCGKIKSCGCSKRRVKPEYNPTKETLHNG